LSRKRLTFEDFIIKAKEVHGDRYCYDKSEYKNTTTKIDIVCNIHGVFSQRPRNHNNGQGCPKCGTDRSSRFNSLSYDEFIVRANDIHDNFYTYNIDSFTDRLNDVEIACPVHGEFSNKALYHLQGSGCPDCLSSLYSIKIAEQKKDSWILKNAMVYTIRCWNDKEEFFKIGLTTKELKRRFGSVRDMPYKYELIKSEKLNLYEAVYREKELHNINKDNQYTPNIKFGGYDECFSKIVQ
jgi:hypothetical protein